MGSFRRPVGAIALALATVLAACGDDGDDGEATGGTATTAVVAGTGSDAVDVTMTEFAYAVSGPLSSGGTIRLRNAGQEIHMMGLARLREGKTIADATTVLDGLVAGTAEEGQDPFADVFEGELGAPSALVMPETTTEVTVPTFGEGRYAMICFIPVEGETTPHFAKGMIGQLTVVGDQAAEPTADAVYSLEPGQPVTGPSTLSAGRHVIKFEAGPGSEGLEPAMAKPDPGKTVADINRTFESFEQDGETILPANAASLLPGEIIFSIFDLYEADELYVGVDLSPGTYVIDVHDTDVEDGSDDPIEQATVIVT